MKRTRLPLLWAALAALTILPAFTEAAPRRVETSPDFISRPADIRQTAARAEKLADSFRADLKRALDRSVLDNSKAQRKANDYAHKLENELDKLRKEAGREKFKPVRNRVKNALKQAEKLDRIMREVRLDEQVHSQWAALLADLGSLAYFYELEPPRT